MQLKTAASRGALWPGALPRAVGTQRPGSRRAAASRLPRRPPVAVRAGSIDDGSGGGDHECPEGWETCLGPAAAAEAEQELGATVEPGQAEHAVLRARYPHLAISSVWDEEMLEETAEREREHLCRSGALPGCSSAGGPAGEACPPDEPGSEPGSEPAEQADGAPPSQQDRAAGGGGGGGGSAGGGPAASKGRCLLLEPVEGPEGPGPQRHRGLWRVRLSPCDPGGAHAALPPVGGPTIASAASAGEEPPPAASGTSPQPKPRRQRKAADGSSSSSSRKKQLKAGDVSLPAPSLAPAAAPPAAEPPSADADAAARWAGAPPLAPPLAAAERSWEDGISYADPDSRLLLERHEPLLPPFLAGGGGQQAEGGGRGGRQPQVLRLFSVEDTWPGGAGGRASGTDYADSIAARGSFVGVAAWVLAGRIVALGQLAWGMGLRTQLPRRLRRPADLAFWAAFLWAAAIAPLW